MEPSAKQFPCDGCGLPADPEHLAARIRRLELATRFRPVHIGVLFVALAPALRLEDDFYTPGSSRDFSKPLLDALKISASATEVVLDSSLDSKDAQRLTEFQKRGHYLAYLSECPILEADQPPGATVVRLGPNLIRRIRFNYKPKHVAVLGQNLSPLVELLVNAGIGPALILNEGLPLPFPGTGGKDWKTLFQRSVPTVSPS